MKSRHPARLFVVALMAAAAGACASSSDSGSPSGSGSASPSATTCEEWNELSLQEQQAVVVELYQEASSNPSQQGASAAVRNVEFHCSQQPGLKLSGIDMDY